MPLLEAVIFSSLWAFGFGQLTLKQPAISVSRAKDKSAHIPCKMSAENPYTDYIHWYRQKPDQSIEHLLHVDSTNIVQKELGGNKVKLQANKVDRTSTSTLTINFLAKEDEAVYYCACWTGLNYDRKVFGGGTKLVITDRNFGTQFSPKPTIFLPSMAEVNLQNTGTYLCLLENFFPDVIKVHWKEKNSNTILESQQGNTMKTNDTYMKFSWLTVTAKSMDKEHKCIVRHENNIKGVDQEILFPSIKKEVAANNPTEKACLKEQSGTLQLQLTSTAAYYTYLLLLLKSIIYFAIVAFCLFRRTAVCGDGKSP